jgi:hypothetical protein
MVRTMFPAHVSRNRQMSRHILIRSDRDDSECVADAAAAFAATEQPKHTHLLGT